MPEPLLIVLLTWKATVLSCVSWRDHMGWPRRIVFVEHGHSKLPKRQHPGRLGDDPSGPSSHEPCSQEKYIIACLLSTGTLTSELSACNGRRASVQSRCERYHENNITIIIVIKIFTYSPSGSHSLYLCIWICTCIRVWRCWVVGSSDWCVVCVCAMFVSPSSNIVMCCL